MDLDFSLSKPTAPEAEESESQEETRDIIILGSGPAGLSAALYAGRANLKPLVLGGAELGGQINTTSEVENYPGFNGATGPELVEIMQDQAKRFGTDLKMDLATAVDLSQHPFKITTYSQEYYTKALIIATGASHRKLNVPGEADLLGRGVSYCATCDGFFFRGKKLVVVGGGDSAMEEAIFLTKFASQVTVVHRRDELRAGYVLEKRAKKNEKIEFIWDSVVTKVNGEEAVTGVELKNTKTEESWTHPADGVFIAIGHIPNSDLFEGQLEIGEQGHLIVDERYRTSVEGVWAAGEIADDFFRQAITSAGMGAAAAIDAERWLSEQEE